MALLLLLGQGLFSFSCTSSFQYSAPQCGQIAFSDTSSGTHPPVSWSWNFGDGSFSTQQNPTHQFTANGNFTVSLTITTTDGCSDTSSQVVSIACYSCSPAFSVSQTGCPTLQFSDLSTSQSGTVLSWSWDFGDGSFSTQQNPSHVYQANGTYMVSLTIVASNGCTQSTTSAVNVSCYSCTASFQYSAPQCGQIAFSDTSSGTHPPVSWSWNFGDGSFSTQQNPTHQFTANGNFTVSLTITTTDGCSDTSSQVVSIACYSCSPAFSVSQTGCPTLQFSDLSTSQSGTVLSWSWDFGDGSFSTQQNPSHVYQANGTYMVSLTIVASNGCTQSTASAVNVSCYSCISSFQYSSPQCGQIAFSDATSGTHPPVSWSWNFGDGSFSTQQNPTHQFTANGNFTVSLTITTTDGCSDTSSQVVSIACASCTSLFDFSRSACPTLSFLDLSVSPAGAIQSWSWDFGDGDFSTIQNPNHTYLWEGVFPVCLQTVDLDGCLHSHCRPVLVACELLNGFELWRKPSSAGLFCTVPSPTVLDYLEYLNAGLSCP
jgi:PKD repeat protein